jgi:8-oxo-dGTP diphosphatase
MSLAGSWEFPGGKVEPDESSGSALIRELREELGLEVDVGPWIGRGESIVGDREIMLDVYYASLIRGEPHPMEHSEAR